METFKRVRDDLAMAERFGVLANRILGFNSEEYQRPGECAIAELTAVYTLPSGEELEEGKFFFAFEDGECREWWTTDQNWRPHLLTGLADMLQVVEVESEIGSFWKPEGEDPIAACEYCEVTTTDPETPGWQAMENPQ